MTAKIEDVIDRLPKVDLLLTDPPYGIDVKNLSSSNSKSKKAKPKIYKRYDWMNKKLADQKIINRLVQMSNFSIIWGGNYYQLPPSSCWLYWDKEATSSYADGILAWTNLPGALRSFKWRWNGMLKEAPESRWHPTQMPEAVVNFSLDQFEEKLGRKPNLVLDPYAGSGTTLACCNKRGIDCIGVEMIEEYTKLIEKRLSQGALF